MQCQYCHLVFQSGRHYGRHLRADHPNQPVAGHSDKSAIDVPEPSLVTAYKRHRTLSSAVPPFLKRPKGSIGTTAAAADRQEPTPPTEEPRSSPESLPPQYAAGRVIKRSIFKHVRSQQFDALAPFANVYEYKLARFFHQSKTTLKQIDDFFKNNLLPADLPETASVHFKLGLTWRNKMRDLVDLPTWHRGKVDFYLQQGCGLNYRNI